MLGHWSRHDIWIYENLKFDYLKNKTAFEMKKNFFSLFHKSSLLDIQNKLVKI